MGCIILSCRFVCWIILYWLDRIYGSYSIGWIGWIGLAGLDWIISYWLDEDPLAFMHWIVKTRMGRMDWMGRWWDGGGTDGR